MKNENVINEKDALFDILTGEKNLVKVYGFAITEAYGKDVRKTMKTNMFETAEEQYKLFETMRKNGYCEVNPADSATVEKRAEKFSKALKALEK